MARFEDGKDQGALRTIGEVADALGIKQHVLRYWEQQFPLLQPLKRSGGRRYYRPQDIALVEAINRLVNQEGYTLKGAKKALLQKGTMTPPDAPEPETEAEIADLSPPPLAASPGFPFTSELPEDGGVDAFFGSPSQTAKPASDVSPSLFPEYAPESAPTLVPEQQAARSDNSDVVAALKAIRSRLAAALAA